MTKPTLDYITASISQKIVDSVTESAKSEKAAKELENLATKTLGVLQSQGIYATMLFLISNADETGANEIINWLYTLTSPEKFKELNPKDSKPDINYSEEKRKGKNKEITNTILDKTILITNNLENLLKIRLVWEQLLIYLRYHAKAAQKLPEE